jgi:hypothetical protein
MNSAILAASDNSCMIENSAMMQVGGSL